jgi:hypothetical protein
MEEETAYDGPVTRVKDVLYCEICKCPHEVMSLDLIQKYCEFGVSVTECKQNLLKTNPDLFKIIWPEESLDISQLSVQEKSETKPKKVKAIPKVIVKRVERNKRKYVTAISGLEFYVFKIDFKYRTWI